MESLAAKEAKRRYREKNRGLISGRQRARAVLDPKAEMLRQARYRAKRHGTIFNLKPSDFEVPDMCPVFGTPLSVSMGHKDDNSPSLDRIRPALGYVPGNIVVVSWRANKLKRAIGPEELDALARYYRRYL